MRNHRFLFPTLALLTLVLALPVIAWAQPGGHGFGHHGSGHHGGFGPHRGGGGHGFGDRGQSGPRGEHFLHFMLRGLDLTDAQKEQIRGLLEQEREGAEDRHTALRDAHQSLHQLATAETYDAAAVKAAAETIGRLSAEMAENRARVGNSIYQVLTPEQRQQLEERHERRIARRQERRERSGR